MHDEQIMQHVRSHEDTMRADSSHSSNATTSCRGPWHRVLLRPRVDGEPSAAGLSEPDALALQQGVLLSMCKEAGC